MSIIYFNHIFQRKIKDILLILKIVPSFGGYESNINFGIKKHSIFLLVPDVKVSINVVW